MAFSLYHCLLPRDKTAWLHFMDLSYRLCPSQSTQRAHGADRYPGVPQEPGQFPARLIFRPLSEMLTKVKEHPSSSCQSLSECASREGGEPIPSTRSQCRILHSLWFPAPLCVWAHDTLTQPVNPAKNEPRKQWVVSFQASTELACHIIRHVLELVPVQSCEAGLPICVIPRVPAECKQRRSGIGSFIPEKGIKLSHLLSKQPNQCMNHPQEALVMPSIPITQHSSRKACNSGRLPVKIKTAAISHFGVPMTFLSLSTPQF